MFVSTCVKGFRNHALNKAFGNVENKTWTDRKRLRNLFGKLSNVVYLKLSFVYLVSVIDWIILLPSPASIQYSSTNMYLSSEYIWVF